MRIIAAVCAALVMAPALSFADELVARQGNDSVRLSEGACESQLVLSRLSPDAKDLYKRASAVVGGQTFNACWAVVGNAAHLVYEDGDQGVIPLSDLKPELAA